MRSFPCKKSSWFGRVENYVCLFDIYNWMQVQNPITLSNLSDSLCMFWQLFASVCSHPRSYHEFICFIHLVTCATRGVPVPESTPPQLLDSLMNLEPLEVLVAEREESRSRSGSRRSLSPMVTGGAQSRGRSPEPRTFTAERWAPSRREKRKYACLRCKCCSLW